MPILKGGRNVRYTLTDDELLWLLSVYRTVPAAARSMTASWTDYTDIRAKMKRHVGRLEKTGRMERVGMDHSGTYNTRCVVWAVVG